MSPDQFSIAGCGVCCIADGRILRTPPLDRGWTDQTSELFVQSGSQLVDKYRDEVNAGARQALRVIGTGGFKPLKTDQRWLFPTQRPVPNGGNAVPRP